MFQDQAAQIEALMLELEMLKEEKSTLQSRIEYHVSTNVDKESVARLEAKIRDAEGRLELEQTVHQRMEVRSDLTTSFWDDDDDVVGFFVSLTETDISTKTHSWEKQAEKSSKSGF